MVHYEKSHTNRYDDLEIMAEDISAFLALHPKRYVKVVLYV